MSKVVFKEELCKSCSLCVITCPKKVLTISETKINKKGYHPVQCTDEKNCISCGSCARICPDLVISVYKV